MNTETDSDTYARGDVVLIRTETGAERVGVIEKIIAYVSLAVYVVRLLTGETYPRGRHDLRSVDAERATRVRHLVLDSAPHRPELAEIAELVRIEETSAAAEDVARGMERVRAWMLRHGLLIGDISAGRILAARDADHQAALDEAADR